MHARQEHHSLARRGSRGLTLLLAGFVALAAAGSDTTPASAHERRRDRDKIERRHHGDHFRGWHHEHRWRGHWRHGHLHGHADIVAVPHHLGRHPHRHFRRFYWGRVWVPAHGHFHAIYRFPVETYAGLAYRPFAYCGGHLYAAGRFVYHGPRVTVVFDF